jgi:8-oxo-dGTP pyrophosphatase MutT (NUDIX family)
MLHEKSCGAVVFFRNVQLKYLLLQYEAGHWDFVKGNVEPNESETDTVLRELKEETNLDVENVDYLIDMVFVRGDGIPVLVMACTCDFRCGQVKLPQEELTEYAWVNLEEAKNYDLITGVYEELQLAFRKRGYPIYV